MDKVQKIREEVEKLKSQLLRGACSSHLVAMETLCKEEAYNEVLVILDSMQEEHISEELEEAAYKFVMDNFGNPKEPLYKFDQRCFKAGAKWQKQQDQSTIELAEDHAMFVGKEKMRDEMVEKACKYLDKLIEVLNNYGHTLKKEHIIYGLKRAMQEK